MKSFYPLAKLMAVAYYIRSQRKEYLADINHSSNDQFWSDMFDAELAVMECIEKLYE